MAENCAPMELEEGEIIDEGSEAEEDETEIRMNRLTTVIATKREDLREMRALKRRMLNRILDIRTALSDIEDRMDNFEQEYRYWPCRNVRIMNSINTMFTVQDSLVRQEEYLMDPLRRLTKWITEAKKILKSAWLEKKDLMYIGYNICDDSEFFDEGAASEWDIFDWEDD